MPVIRVKKNENYTVMSNFHLRDMRLSNKAIGLMCKMLSLPDSWDYTVNGLSAICKDGRDSISSQLKELEATGYLRREQSRAQGKFGDVEYILTEKPFTKNPSTENPYEDNERIRLGGTSNAENPLTENPITENPIQLNTNISKKERKNISNKEGLSLVKGRSDSFKEAWQGFVDMRKANKKPMTERAAKMILKKLDKLSGGDEEKQIAILDKSVVKCWSDVYELKEQYGTPNHAGYSQKSNSDIAREFMAMVESEV
jgi:hypothetical protein